MAPKNQSRFVDQPPSASSSEEEEDSSQEEEEEQSEEKEKVEEEEEEDSGEEESDEEEPKSTPLVGNKSSTQKPSQIPQKPSQIPQKPISSSESGTEDGSDSESDSDKTPPSPSASDFTVKPSVPPKAPSKPPSKRPLETPKEKDSKNKKIKVTEEDKASEEKKSLSTPNRLWSDEDQVAILKGILEFKSQKGLEPNADMTAFHDFMKRKLQVEVSKSQLSDKMRRLKKKFTTIIEKGEKPVFSKPHEYLMFEISTKIWGNGGKVDSGTSDGVDENVNKLNGESKKTDVVKKNSESKKSSEVSTSTKTKGYEKQVAVKEAVKENIVKGEDFQSKYPCMVASIAVADLSALYPLAAEVFKENMSLISSDRAQDLEEKWKKLRDEEADLMMKRLDLIKEHYEAVVKAMRGN